MDRVFFFDFESRTWSQRMCKDVLPTWLFGHATKRGRSIFAFGSSRGESGTLEVKHPHTSIAPGQDLAVEYYTGCTSQRMLHNVYPQSGNNALI